MSGTGKEPTKSPNGKNDQMTLMEAISYDELDDDTGMLQIVDEEDVGLNYLLPRTMASDTVTGGSMDNLDLERYEDDSNQFEILPDEEDEEDLAAGSEEDLAGGSEEEGCLEKVKEESEDELLESMKYQKTDEKEGKVTPSSSPRSHRKMFKLPVNVLSPPRIIHKKPHTSPGAPKSPGASTDLGKSPGASTGPGKSPGASTGSKKIKFIPQSVEKAIRSKMASYKGNEDSIDFSGTLQERSEDFFSDDSSSDELSLGSNSFLLEDDDDHTLDFSSMGVLPNSFLNPPPSSYDYLDQDVLKSVGQQDFSKFAREHHLLSRGLMQLMAERDHIGVEDDVDDSKNVLKMGPLKLLKRNLKQKNWTVKLVEIRKGNLAYYDDKAMKGGKSVRTTVHLRKRTCRCEAVTNTKDLSSSGFVFALIDEGAKRHWMAKSEEEMESWIRTINKAMIGETDESMDIPLNMAQYQKAIEEYDSVRNFLRNAETQKDYMAVAGKLLRHHSATAALRVPMRWVREEVFEDQDMEQQEGDAKKDAPRYRVKSAVADFWNILCRTSIAINGYLVEGNSHYSGERIIGALSRCLLEYDKVDRDMSHKGNLGFVKRPDAENFLTEAQAVSHARSILTGALKSKDRNEGLLTVKKLVENENVVECVEVMHREPMHVDVSFAGDDFSGEYEQEISDHSGFAQSRIKEHKSWKERYLVLSGGVLTIYMDANPRPYGLRGQFVLKDTKVETIDEENVIKIHDKDNQQRQFLFEDRSDFVKWKFTIDPSTFDRNEESLDSSFVTAPSAGNDPELKKPPIEIPGPPPTTPDANDDGKKKSRMGTATMVAKDTGERAYRAMKGATKGATKGANKVMKGARDAGIGATKGANKVANKVMKGARDAGIDGIDRIKKIIPRPRRRPNGRRRQARRRPTADMILTSTRALNLAAGKREPTVQVVVELRRVFKVVAKDPNEEGQTTLVEVHVKLFHAFLVSGGSHGRLVRGDELIDMEFVNGDVVPNTDATFLEVPTAL